MTIGTPAPAVTPIFAAETRAFGPSGLLATRPILGRLVAMISAKWWFSVRGNL
jgi:hypothetical protein